MVPEGSSGIAIAVMVSGAGGDGGAVGSLEEVAVGAVGSGVARLSAALIVGVTDDTVGVGAGVEDDGFALDNATFDVATLDGGVCWGWRGRLISFEAGVDSVVGLIVGFDDVIVGSGVG